MPIQRVEVEILTCPRCLVSWMPRVTRPKICWYFGYRFKQSDFEGREAESAPRPAGLPCYKE